MKKIVTVKIHFGFAVFIIITLSIIPTVLFLSLLLMPSPADAFLGFDVGLLVLSPPVKCVISNIDGDCLASCPICGSTAICNSLFEVKALYLSGINVLQSGVALCVTSPVTPYGQPFVPGAHCLGKVFPIPIGYHFLYNFSCGL